MAQPTEVPGGALTIGREISQSPAEPISMSELGAVLVRHYGLTEGLFEVTVEFQLGVGALGPNSAELMPSAIASVKRVGLRRVPDSKPGPGLIDAASVGAPRPVASIPIAVRSTPPKKKPAHRDVKKTTNR